ncbi:MAG TPA: aminotransferase class III-fold pyridoxal phosphate-dependent enzyme [Thermomicrobiales bacterium]|nr:aminotransferase class III-fold pyridoxal phosphate-dependent enzyme [Thermomicrobiales bacterium]
MVFRHQQRELVVQAEVGAAIVADYVASHPKSAEHHARATRRFPSGVTHDGRHLDPFQLCVTHAHGPHKWDADGHRYIDLVTGHGSLILGHGHPEVTRAVSDQLVKGTHLGGSHELELEWAERVCAIVPGAEQVRFVSSGSEAIMLAVRLARTFTGRVKLVQFRGHFHGWSDTAVGAAGETGVPAVLSGTGEVIECGDEEAVVRSLADELAAALIIETSHPNFNSLPDPGAFLRFVRDETERRGTLLIVDEVVSGFRWAPGGAQEKHGVHGDLTTLAKILAGGLPGGAITGRADVISVLSFDPSERGGRPKVKHPGTYNANPLSSSAGIACLNLVADPAIQRRATEAASGIRAGMNAALRHAGIPGCVYGEASMFRIVLGGDEVPPADDMRAPLPGAPIEREGMPGDVAQALLLSMLMEGVALFGGRGITSIAHGAGEVREIVSAFEVTLDRLGLA